MSEGTARAFPYPVLEEGNQSFPKGSYEPEIEMDKGGAGATIQHYIQGARLIENLLKQGKAQYACTLAIPKTMYRRTYTSQDPEHKITWDSGYAGEAATLQPLIVCSQDVRRKLTKADEVSPVWQGIQIRLEAGAKIALGPFSRTTGSKQKLIRLKREENLPAGTFRVEAHTEQGFYFSVKAHPNLFNFLRNPGENTKHRMAIMTGIVTQCMNILEHQYGKDEDEENWDALSELRMLEQKLENEGIPSWTSEDFKADVAASTLYPFLTPEEESSEG